MVYQSKIFPCCNHEHHRPLNSGVYPTVNTQVEKELHHINTYWYVRGIKTEHRRQVKTRGSSSDENTREKTKQHLVALKLGAGERIIKVYIHTSLCCGQCQFFFCNWDRKRFTFTFHTLCHQSQSKYISISTTLLSMLCMVGNKLFRKDWNISSCVWA